MFDVFSSAPPAPPQSGGKKKSKKGGVNLESPAKLFGSLFGPATTGGKKAKKTRKH